MTHRHPPLPPDLMPLDPEERALAERLVRLGPHGEPSPALDARVLAAAHAATAHGRRAGPRQREHGWRRARWPVGVGVAASVALAAAITWQMRPLPVPVVPPPESATPATATASAPADAVAAAPVAEIAGPQPSPAPPGPPGAATAMQERPAAVAAPAAAAPAAAPKATAPPAEEPAVVFDESTPVAAAAPPPPPAPPAAPAPPSSSASAARSAAAAAEAPATVQSREAQPVFDTAGADAPEGDVPPATVASPQVRDAWLARIRELVADGHMDEARASLAEFHRRYPGFAVPDDLRPLLPPSPAPQPQP